MAAAGHAIKEVVSPHRCECGENYEQWGSRPTPPCLTCEKSVSEKQHKTRRELKGPKEPASEPSTKKARTKGK